MMEDAEAVRAVLAGDRDAYAHVVRRYHRRLYYYVVGKIVDEAEAEDVVQRTFVSAFGRLGDYDAARPLLAWLRGIALNHLRNDLRVAVRQARLRDRLVEARRLELQGAWMDEPEEQGEARIAALRKCVRTLGDDEQTAVRMRFVEERPLRDVGQALARDGEAARLFLFRIRQRLADCVRKRLALGEAP